MCIFECCSFLISSIIKSVCFSIKKEHILILLQSINISVMEIFLKNKNIQTTYSYYPILTTIISYLLLSILWFIFNKIKLKEKKVLIENSYKEDDSQPIGEIDVNKIFLPEIQLTNKIKMAILLYFISLFSPFTYYVFKYKFQVKINGKYICFSLIIFFLYSKKYLKKKCYIRYWFSCVIFFIFSILFSYLNNKNYEIIYISIFFIFYGFETILFHYYMNIKYVNVSVMSIFQSLSFLTLEIIKIFFFNIKSSETLLYFELTINQENIIYTILNSVLIILYFFINNLTINYLDPGNNIFPYIIKLFFEINYQSLDDFIVVITGLFSQLLFNELIIINFTLICKKEIDNNISLLSNMSLDKYDDVI